MTIKHKKGEHGLTRNKYICDVCKKLFFWNDGASSCSSENHVETCPDDILTACSEQCGKKMMIKVENGEFVLPRLRCTEYFCKKISDRVGY